MPSSGGWAKPPNGLVSWLFGVEGAVGDHQRQVASPARQREGARRRRRRGSTSRRGRARCCGPVLSRRWSWYHWNGGTLGLAVLDAVEGVCALAARARSAGRCPASRSREAGGDVAVEGLGCIAVRPPGWPSSSERLWPPWRWTLSSPAELGQPVAEGDLGGLAGRAADSRTREGAAVGPHLGRAAGEDVDLGLGHVELDLGRGERPRAPAAGRGRAAAGGARVGEGPKPGQPGADRQRQRRRPGPGRSEKGPAPEAAPVLRCRAHAGRPVAASTGGP